MAEPQDVDSLYQVIKKAFSARRPLNPPAEALSETPEKIADFLTSGYAVVAELDGEIIGCLLIDFVLAPADTVEAKTSVESSTTSKTVEKSIGEPDRPGQKASLVKIARLSRVSVAPQYQRHGIASAMVVGAGQFGLDQGATKMQITARKELPHVVSWWQAGGFEIVSESGHEFQLVRRLPEVLDVPTSEDMHELGRQLAPILKQGDLIVASGDLGAGKTTLAQGLGEGLNVAGPIISPTFVLSRIHPGHYGGPDFVHVDAYRLSSAAELEDIDLDTSFQDSITFVEWGTGIAEGLSESRLEIVIARSANPADNTRKVYLTGIGPRWQGVELTKVINLQTKRVKAAVVGIGNDLTLS